MLRHSHSDLKLLIQVIHRLTREKLLEALHNAGGLKDGVKDGLKDGLKDLSDVSSLRLL